MSRSRLVALTVVGVAIVAFAAWPPSEEPTPDRKDRVETRTKTREKPSDEEIKRRRKARLMRMSRGKVVEAKLVKLRALRCGLMPAPQASIAVDMGNGPVQVGETDDLGKLTIRVPKVGKHTYIATHDEHDGAEGPTDADEISVNACPGATVIGKVVDPKGDPVEGAEVVLGEEQDVAVTDENGEFMVTDMYLTALRLAARNGQLSAEVSLDPPLNPREERTLNLRLERGRRLVGVVLDREGTPVPKATVMALAGAEMVTSTRADRRGRFWLKGVPFVPLSLQALSDRGASKPLPVGETEARSDLVLTIEPGAMLVFKGGGADATYQVYDKRRPAAAPMREVVGDGSRATLNAPGQYEIMVDSPTGGKKSCGEVGVFPGDLIEIDCAAEGDATVTGRVVDTKGDALGGVNIYAFSRSSYRRSARRVQATTSSDGTFSFKLDERGQITVGAFVPEDGGGYGRKTGIPVSPGVVSDVGDITILTRDERQAMFRQRKFYGVGAVITRTSQGPVFQRLVDNGPLARAGVKAYDVILAVDGQTAYNESVMGLVRKLRGEEGSSVTLTLWRDGQELEVDVERGPIDADKAF